MKAYKVVIIESEFGYGDTWDKLRAEWKAKFFFNKEEAKEYASKNVDNYRYADVVEIEIR